MGAAILEPENNSPVRPDGHGPISPEIALERVKAIAGKVEGLWRRRHIESDKNIFNPVQKIGPDAAAVAAFIQPLQTTMLEALNH